MKRIIFSIIVAVVAIFSIRAAEPKDITYDDLMEHIVKSPTPVVVDCYATWCGPCRQFAPVYDAVAAATGSKAQFYRIDIDESPQIVPLGVRAVPTVLVFYVRNGELDWVTQEGALDQADFQKFINESLKLADSSRIKRN